ncbi:DUF255 domain-containing protein [candidate division KSB1 bacterium]|nr:DUF255 domain-containing protein [candidate division KSB1 bacterium]
MKLKNAQILMVVFLSLSFFGQVFAADVKWHSFDQGLEMAKKQGKTVLVDFYTSWCHWCKVMDEKTFNDKKIAEELSEKFITVRLNAENRNESVTYQGRTFNNAQFTQAFGVTGFPSLAFLDSEGNPITIIPGYIPAEEFYYILKYIDKQCYKQKMPFEEFKKKLECKDK